MVRALELLDAARAGELIDMGGDPQQHLSDAADVDDDVAALESRSRREGCATGAGCGDPGTVGAVSGESNGQGGAGLVLGGGGARGAYASGALSVLLPELKDQVRVIVGTSAGR